MVQYAVPGFCQEQNREQEDECVVLALKTGKPQSQTRPGMGGATVKPLKKWNG